MKLDRRRGRRVVGALWFAAWGVLAAGSMFLFPALDRGAVDVALFVLLPGVSALPAGALVGPGILAPSRFGPWKAVGLGLAAAVLAHLVFAPLFALAWWAGAPGTTELPGVWFAAVLVGLPATGLVTLPAGAFAGWLLYSVERRIRRSQPANDANG